MLVFCLLQMPVSPVDGEAAKASLLLCTPLSALTAMPVDVPLKLRALRRESGHIQSLKLLFSRAFCALEVSPRESIEAFVSALRVMPAAELYLRDLQSLNEMLKLQRTRTPENNRHRAE